MNLTRFAFVVCLLALLSCNSDDMQEIDDDIQDDGDDVELPCEATGPPEFVVAPTPLPGLKSVDFTVQTEAPAVVYYILSDTTLEDNTPANIKSRAQAHTGFLSSGSITISCDDVDSLARISIDSIPKDQQLYAYFIAESYVSDTVLQEEATTVSFTSEERLAIKSFPSAIKSRDALYVRYLPDEEAYKHPEKKTYPLILFLGGNGEVAPEGEIALIQNGSIPKYLSDGNDIPFIVIAPEHTTEDWDSTFVNEMVEYSMEHYPVDPDRIIITGMSGGGIGTWSYAMTYPDVPAAIVPISGEGDTTRVCVLTGMAVRAFHNDNDPKVPVEGSISMINNLKACSPPPEKEVDLTVFKDEGHNCWIRVYNPESVTWEYDTTVAPFNIYDWMYEQSK